MNDYVAVSASSKLELFIIIIVIFTDEGTLLSKHLFLGFYTSIVIACDK